jgi:hypothetical protein
MEHLRYDFHMLFAILGVITQITHFFLNDSAEKRRQWRPWYHGGLPSLRSILHSTLFAQATTEGRLGLVVEPFMAARGGNVGNGPEKWPS